MPNVKWVDSHTETVAMAQTVSHLAPKPDPKPDQKPGQAPDPERHLWLPPRRMRRYHLNKIFAALLFCIMFASWMYFQWADPVQRLLPMGLAVITVLVTGTTVMGDINRSRGRQIALKTSVGRDGPGGPDESDLEIVTPQDKK